MPCKSLSRLAISSSGVSFSRPRLGHKTRAKPVTSHSCCRISCSDEYLCVSENLSEYMHYMSRLFRSCCASYMNPSMPTTCPAGLPYPAPTYQPPSTPPCLPASMNACMHTCIYLSTPCTRHLCIEPKVYDASNHVLRPALSQSSWTSTRTCEEVQDDPGFEG